MSKYKIKIDDEVIVNTIGKVLSVDELTADSYKISVEIVGSEYPYWFIISKDSPWTVRKTPSKKTKTHKYTEGEKSD